MCCEANARLWRSVVVVSQMWFHGVESRQKSSSHDIPGPYPTTRISAPSNPIMRRAVRAAGLLSSRTRPSIVHSSALRLSERSAVIDVSPVLASTTPSPVAGDKVPVSYEYFKRDSKTGEAVITRARSPIHKRPYWWDSIPIFRGCRSSKDLIDRYEALDGQGRMVLSEGVRRHLLEVLDPRDFVKYSRRCAFGPKPHAHSIHNSHWRGKAITLTAWEDAVKEYLSRLNFMLKSLREDRIPLNASCFERIMIGAEAIGSLQVAQMAWKEMRSLGITPNLRHYTYLLALLVDGFSVNRRYVAYGTEIMKKRTASKQASFHRGDPSMPEDYRSRMINVLEEMDKDGVEPDIGIAELMLLAYARMGDQQGVETLMKKFWKIDIENPKAGIDTSTLNEKLRPRTETLIAVCMAFGVSLKIGKALHAVDIMSREYDVPFDSRVAEGLIVWTYLATGMERSLPAKKRQLQPDSTQQIFQALRVPPYNIERHTIESYDVVARSFVWRGMTTEALKIVREMQDVFDIRKAFEFPEEERKVTDSEYREARKLSQLRRLIEMVILNGSQKNDDHLDLSLRQIPNIINEFYYALGHLVNYVVPTGHVTLYTGKEPWMMEGAVREGKWRPAATYGRKGTSRYTQRWRYDEKSRYGAAAVGLIDWIDD